MIQGQRALQPLGGLLPPGEQRARVVGQHVQPVMGRPELSGDAAHLRHPGEVSGQDSHPGSRAPPSQLGGQRLQAGAVPGHQHQLHPHRGEGLGRGPADPEGGPGEQTDPWARLGHGGTVAAGSLRQGCETGTSRVCESFDTTPCAASSASTVTPRPRTSRTSGCTRSSIAVRSPRASSARTATACTRGGRWGSWPDVFGARELEALPGSSAIGHVRYSTAGVSQAKNAQPLTVQYAGGKVAVAHNGNLVNAQTLRARARGRGRHLPVDSDTEVIIHLIARSRAAEARGAGRRGAPAVRRAPTACIFGLTEPRSSACATRTASGRWCSGGCARPTCWPARPPRSTSSRPSSSARSSPARWWSSTSNGLRSSRPFAGRAPRPLRLRARLLRQARLGALREQRLRDAQGARAAAGPGAAGALGGSGHRRAGLGRAGRHRLRAGLGHPLRRRSHPQPLRRPHLHRAAAVHPPLRGEAEALRGPRGAQGQAGGGGGRLHRPRHHLAEDRQDDQGGRRSRGAPAHLQSRPPGGPATTASTRRCGRSSSPPPTPPTRSPRYVTADSLGYLSVEGLGPGGGRPRAWKTFCNACFSGNYLTPLEPPQAAPATG